MIPSIKSFPKTPTIYRLGVFAKISKVPTCPTRVKLGVLEYLGITQIGHRPHNRQPAWGKIRSVITRLRSVSDCVLALHPGISSFNSLDQ